MRLPILATGYAALMCIILLGGTNRALKEHRPYWFVAAGAAHSIILITLFVGYWEQHLIRPLGPVALLLFGLALLWPLATAPRFLKDIDMPEVGPHLNRLHKAFWLAATSVADFPAYW